MITAVVGLNWGDEGKGRMVDYFASKADCVIRYQGGDNAGHTVVNHLGKFALHSVPSGIFHSGVTNLVASGSVINPESLTREIETLKERGIDMGGLKISDRAILIFPFHLLLERLEEERLGSEAYGSTMSGISPVYSHKYIKKGIQVGELLHPAYLKEHLEAVINYVNLLVCGGYGAEPVLAEEMLQWVKDWGAELQHRIVDSQALVRQLTANGRPILLEAQLGALRDITHGIYPFTTSSSTLAGYACASVPIHPNSVEQVIGVTKAYSTCVGAGPFVTEFEPDDAAEFRRISGEYGARTGRPRRIGHFDAVATRYGRDLQGPSAVSLTCLDLLTGQGELKICTAYDINGNPTTRFPLNAGLDKARPLYERFAGWDEDITAVRDFDNLPAAAQAYVLRIEELLDVPVKYISVGPEREALIARD